MVTKREENLIKLAYSKVINVMSKEFRLAKKDFPRIKIVEGNLRAYDHTDNIIIFGRENALHAIEVLSEEVGHYIRARLRGIGKDTSIDESGPKEFGFQASLMVYEKMTPEERNKFFPHGRPTLLEHYETAKRAKKVGKNILGIIIIFGVVIAIFLFSGRLTGYLIAGYEIQILYGFVLLLVLIVLGVIWLWLKNQNIKESEKLKKQIYSITDKGI